jgi:DME family drug/metabolite transporter
VTPEPTPAHAWSGLALVCAAGILWGTIGPAVHVVHDRSGFSILTIGALRAVAAVAVLVLAAAAGRRLNQAWSLAHRHWRQVALVGALTACFQVLFFVAVVAAGVSVPTVVALGVAPLLLLLLDSARARRPPSRFRVLTVTVAVVGLVLVVLPGGEGPGGSQPLLGALAALGSGVAYALSADLAAPLSRRHDALALTTATTVVAAAVLVPAGLVWTLVADGTLATPDLQSWSLVVYLGVVTMALAYLLLYAGLRSTPSGTAVVATLLEPVTAVLIALVLLGETLTLPAAVGACLIISAIATLGRRPEEPVPQ